MFPAETKAFVKSLGSGKNLIHNKDVNQQMNLLTLVRIRSGRLWAFPKYKVMNCTLPALIGKEEYSPDAEEKVLVEDFKTCLKTDGSGKLKGGLEGPGTAELSVSSDCMDGLVQPVSIRIKKANLTALREKFSGRNIDKGMLKLLKLKKKDKLAFVNETAYNTGPVTMFRKGSQKGYISGSLQKMATICISVDMQQETTFTVMENSTFAYSLVEILLEEDKIEISLEKWTHKRKDLTNDALDPHIMEQVQNKIKNMECLMTPLEQLPESTRGDLLKRLREVLKEEDALSELEEMLDESADEACEHPQSRAVASFIDVLEKSKESSKVKDAAFLLVSAMNVLPEEMLRPLTSCGPETLTVLNQLVESLKDGDEVRLPESVPVPLQQDGELRWAADLLCSCEETLAELSDSWNLPPEVLLEVLALTVMGVHMLQNGC